jgi:3-deoxy-D-manno-octulosonic acid (KDO) 8-phosphate synthase
VIDHASYSRPIVLSATLAEVANDCWGYATTKSDTSVEFYFSSVFDKASSVSNASVRASVNN